MRSFSHFMKVPLLAFALLFSATARPTAAILETLYDFPTNSHPYARIVLGFDGAFYGTTVTGGTNSFGTVFRMTPVGETTILVSFTGTNGVRPGAYPYGDLVQATDGKLYGTTYSGGSPMRG